VVADKIVESDDSGGKLNSTKVGQELKERLSKKPCMSFALSQN